MKYIVLEYEPTNNLDDNEAPIDIYDYLLNEFNNHDIVCRMIGYDFDPRRKPDE